MKPRFTFQYLYHLPILNTFHQVQGMKANSAVSCLFTIDFYQDHVSIVTYLLLNDGRAHVSEATHNTHSCLQQLTAENDSVPNLPGEPEKVLLLSQLPLSLSLHCLQR